MEPIYTFGDVFAGIGGLSLGLERTKRFRSLFQVEIDPYCNRVLEMHWPDVVRYGDIRECKNGTLPSVDVLAGCFPCQDVSLANKVRSGLSGDKSGIWDEFLRIVCDIRPRVLLVENVAGLRYPSYQTSSGVPQPAPLATILIQLADAGYDAEWTSLFAYQFGFPHYRERCFLVAYAHGGGWSGPFLSGLRPRTHPTRPAKTDRMAQRGHLISQCEQRLGQPCVFGNDPGIPYRMDRLRVLGNAVMPDMIEAVGMCILAFLDAGVVSDDRLLL